MPQYHVAFYLPKGEETMVVADVLDFPGAVSQGYDLDDARSMIAEALALCAEALIGQGRPLPAPDPNAAAPEADLVELISLSGGQAERPVPRTVD
jgi:predicted RNase H-like HicB family nuclease